MKVTFTTLAASAGLLALSGIGMSQDASMHGHGTETPLPKACLAAGADVAAQPPMDSAQGMGMMPDMGEAQKALTEGMMQTQGPMMAGMMARDPDVAFICGMIPHHQGAINMARVQLQYGDDAWAKTMAQKIIDSQEREIAEMTAWLEKQAP